MFAKYAYIYIMSKLYFVFGSIAIMLITLLLFLYFFAGGKTYLRTLITTYQTEVNEKNRIKADFFSKEKTDFNSGILAGSIGDRVWFWDKSGLVSYKTDENTFFYYKDWCSDKAQAAIKNGEALDVNVFNSLKEWRELSKAGDYLVFKISTINNGGITGNLREIRSYNYLPFLEGDINTLCKK